MAEGLETFTAANGTTMGTLGFTQLGSGWTDGAQVLNNELAGVEGDSPVWGKDPGDDEHFAEMVVYSSAIWEDATDPDRIFRLWVAVTDRNVGMYAAYDDTDGWGIYKAGTAPGRNAVAANNSFVSGGTYALVKSSASDTGYNYTLYENGVIKCVASTFADAELDAVTNVGFSCQAADPGDILVPRVGDNFRWGTFANFTSVSGGGGGSTYSVTAAFHMSEQLQVSVSATFLGRGAFRVTEGLAVRQIASVGNSGSYGFSESFSARVPVTIAESVGFGFTQGMEGSYPTSVACAGLDFFGWQGVWLGGFKQQQEANITSVTYNESVGFQLSQGLDIIDRLTVLGTGSFSITKELTTNLLGAIYNEEVGFGLTNDAAVGSGFALLEEVVLSMTHTIRADVEGGCGPSEQWEDEDSPVETWEKGPC